MIKVLIADDDNIVRIGLSSLIDWEANGYTLIGKAADGHEALELCKKSPPDILITDVEMPKVDGIELIDKMHEINPRIKIMVLSNHDNFQYVSNSFKKGVSDYLLKQFLEPEDLLKALDKISKSIMRENGADRSAQIPADDKKEQINKSRKDRIREISEKLSKPDAPAQSAALSLRFLTDKKPESNMQVLGVALNEKINKYADTDVLLDDEDFLKAAVVLTGNISESKLTDASRDILELAESFFGMSCNIGISGISDDGNVEKIIDNADTAREFIDFMGKAGVYENVSYLEESEQLSSKIIQLVNGMHDHLMLLDIDKPISELKEILTAIDRDNYVKLKTIKHSLNSIFYQILIFLSDYFEENYDSVLEKMSALKEILNLEREPTLISILEKIEKAHAQISGYILKYKSKTGYMSKVKEYIDENYTENLSLKSLAEKFSISGKYLSSEFKKKMNINIIEYINKVRIQKAIDLMHKTDLTAADIAGQTGFSSPNYFIRVFKKVTGKTVSEYRSLE